MTRASAERHDRDFESTVAAAISVFGASVKPKLLAAEGHHEDQLRGPLETFVQRVGASLSLDIIPVGEQELPDRSRPDYLVKAAGVPVGHIELKAPGHGAEPRRWSPRSHDRKQWERIKVLPNLLYTDGQTWALYHKGKLSGSVTKLIGGELTVAGHRLAPPDASLARTLHEFLYWEPPVPRSLGQLVDAVSGLCKLLRADVLDRVKRERSGRSPRWFLNLASDWRRLLFPGATDEVFADQYAQTVTFALLLARVEGIVFDGLTITDIALQLGKKHSLMGRALSLLTEDAASELGYVLESMLRVIGVVDWSKLDDGAGHSYLKLYENFLEQYDPKLRKETGSYYTPTEITSFMARLTEDIIRRRICIPKGFASDQVVIIDPAMGTGTFLLEIIDRVAKSAKEDGPGAVSDQLRALTSRLIGFEKQTGPYAVAELRTYQALMHTYKTEPPSDGLRYYVADTLDDPYRNPDSLGHTYEPIARSLRAANRVKRNEPVMVVIGNPPYRERSKALGKWIVKGTQPPIEMLPFPEFDNDYAPSSLETSEPPLNDFIPNDIRSSAGSHIKHLHNLYIYFWRWATWKAFDAHPEAPSGVVTFITTSGYLAGPGFSGMREYMRRTAHEGWIIDLNPEGHQPKMGSRIFKGVQHPLCIGIFFRRGSKQSDVPAKINYISLTGTREEKFAALSELDIASNRWIECPRGWREMFQAPLDPTWASFPAIPDVLLWSSPGLKANRTWVRSPSEDTLRKRWNRLIQADDIEKADLYKESRDANMKSTPMSLHQPGKRMSPFADNPGSEPTIRKYGARSFDIQYIIADARVLNDPRRDLWWSQSRHQVYLSELHNQPLSCGPGVTFTAHVPDMHHYKGGEGGRVFPLYLDNRGKISGVNRELISYLSTQFGRPVTAEDIFSYIAGVMAHPAYVERFKPFINKSGTRFPLTANADLWKRAVNVGSEVIWLHTRGERFFKSEAGRPAQPPRLPQALCPQRIDPVVRCPDEIPETIEYDIETQTLHVGERQIRPVPEKVWLYSISGMKVIQKWFSYRKLEPGGKRSSELDEINATKWPPSYSNDLIDLLNVLGRLVGLEETQEEILNEICAAPTFSREALTLAGVLPAHRRKRGLGYAATQADQIEFEELRGLDI